LFGNLIFLFQLQLTDRSTINVAPTKEKQVMQNQAARNTPQHTVKPLITPQIPSGDESRVEAIFNGVKQHMGFIPDGLRLYSFSPALLETFLGNISYFNSGERLTPSLMAMIRYLVSWESKCSFCIDMNEGFLSNMGVNLDAVRAARNNPDIAPIPAKEMPLLKIALKSLSNPEGVNESDIQAAKAQGWTERDIFDVVAQAASNRAFNYILRTFKVEHQSAFA
jgi:alkylhydroperoxidase family enzyme